MENNKLKQIDLNAGHKHTYIYIVYKKIYKDHKTNVDL